MTKKIFLILSDRLKKYGFLLLIFLLPTLSYSQFFAIINYGSLDTNRVTLNLFKLQKKELTVRNGMKLDSAKAYFQIPTEQGVFVVDFKPKLDTLKFDRCVKLLKPGSTVSFDNIVLSDTNNFKFQIHNLIYYVIIPEQQNIKKQSESVVEIIRLSKLKFTSGTIYFTGDYFRNPIVLRIDKNNAESIGNYFGMTSIGSNIIFENVFYTNEKREILGPLNKTVILD